MRTRSNKVTDNPIFALVGEETTKPAKRIYPTRKVIATAPNETWSIDLAVMTDDITDNDGMSFMLNCVDVFSRYAWSVPIKNKSADEVLNGLKLIVKNNKNIYPNKLWSDLGKEFYNAKIKAWCKLNNIIIYSTYGKAKSAMVERFNRTIKTKIWAYFIANNSHKWIDILPKMMKTYNMTKHRSINMTPNKAHNLDDAGIKNLYSYQYRNVATSNIKPNTFNVGDYVRISRVKGIFEKGYHPNWSLEIFKVIKALNTVPWTYQIADVLDVIIEGSFYEPELMHTKQTPDSDFLVEKIISTKTIKGKKQNLVKWLGHSDKFNSYIDA